MGAKGKKKQQAARSQGKKAVQKKPSSPAATASATKRKQGKKKLAAPATEIVDDDVDEQSIESEEEVAVPVSESFEDSGDDSASEETTTQKAKRSPAAGKRTKNEQENAEISNSHSDDDDDEEDGEDEEDEEMALASGELHPKLAKLITAAREKKSPRWTNRQRTLVMSSRGISFRVRHLIQDLRGLMPHSKKDAKMDRKDKINDILPEICEMRNCNNCVYIEMRKKRDVYMWVSKMPHGPSVKFAVHNIHTLDELKLTGNCLKGSRHLVQFSEDFDSTPHHKLMKELLYQAFAVPNQHPKSKPFVDHIVSFFLLDGHIWFRCYQVSWKAKGKLGKDQETSLVEIGPRFVLEPIRIFEGTFGGPTLYLNEGYNKRATPSKYKQQ